MAFPCAFLHVVGIQHSGPLCRGWAWGGGGWGWAWGLGLAKPQEGRQDPGGKNSGGGTQQGELCPEGGPGSCWSQEGVPGRTRRPFQKRGCCGGGGGGRVTPAHNSKNTSRVTCGLVFLFLFLNGAFIKHQLGLNSHRNSPLPPPAPPFYRLQNWGPERLSHMCTCHRAG